MPRTVLTVGKVNQIHRYIERRNRLRKEASKLSNNELAKMYGVHIRTIEHVLSGRTWKLLG